MRGHAESMTVLRPSSVKQALEMLAKHPDAEPLAGGTDFMVGFNAGELNGRRILDLSGIRAMRSVREQESAGRVSIGALVTHWQLQHDPVIRKRLPLLIEACATIGGRQIQSRGTLGGNLANASPAGDTFPPLAVYDAVVVARAVDRTRKLPLSQFFTGVKRTALGEREIVDSVEISIGRKQKPTRQMFRKVGTRAASAISKTVASGLLWLSRDQRVSELRFALGSMAPTVRRLVSVEQFVRGKKLTGATVEQAVSMLEQDVQPIDDIRSTRLYRLEVSKNMLRDFLRGTGR